MSEKHIVHHQGSPRHDPSSGGDGNEAIWMIGGIAVVGLLVIAFWQVILAATLALAAIGGLGAYIWKIQKHALFVRKELLLYELKRTKMRKEKRNLEIVESRKQILSEEDFHQARKHAQEGFANAQKNARVAADSVCSQLDEQEKHLRDVRLEVLKKASKTKEEKMKRALTKIDLAIEIGKTMKEKLKRENC